MPHSIMRFKYLLLLVLAGMACAHSYGQCSLSISNYTDNVADSTQIDLSGTLATQYTWQFGDGSLSKITGAPTVAHLYADTGNYTVCVFGFDSNTQCRDTVCKSLNLLCSISGSIHYTTDSSGLVHFSVIIMAKDSITDYRWSVTNTLGTIFYNAQSIFDTLNLNLPAGFYSVMVIVNSIEGCADSILRDSILVDAPVRCLFLQQGTPQSKDTYIRSDIPNINFGLSPDFLAEQWNYPGTGDLEARGLMIFDLGAVPPGSIINSAILTLSADNTTANSGNGYPGEPTYGYYDSSILQRIVSPWNQLEVTWNNQPPTTGLNLVSLPASVSISQNYTLDVTSFLEFWIQHPDSNFGMMLSMPNAIPFNNLIFCSSAHPDPALRPALQICYQAPPSACSASITYYNNADSVLFYNQSASADSVLWRFDDGDSSAQNSPVHHFNLNGIHPTTLTVFDSSGSCSAVTDVNVTGIVNDTLCGLVFFDANNNHLYDVGDYPLGDFNIVIDGNSYYTDNTGFYRVPVGGGGHIISALYPQFSYSQTYPTAPQNYSIAATNGDYICGLDFGMGTGSTTGILSEGDKVMDPICIYPNPVQGLTFNVKISAALQTAGVVLVLSDVLGREVSPSRIEEHPGGYKIYLSGVIEPGLYLLKFINHDRQIVSRLTVVN